MSGYVYGVLFKNGLFKVGKTTKPLSRIKTHIGAGRSFGYELQIFFLTEVHDEFSETEKLLIELCSSKFASNTSEYFTGATLKEAKSVMKSLGLLTLWGDKISASGGSILIRPSPTTETWVETGCKVIEKLKAAISNHPKGVSEGVLKNRLRGHDISEALKYLEDSGFAKVEERVHRCQKTINRFYHAVS